MRLKKRTLVGTLFLSLVLAGCGSSFETVSLGQAKSNGDGDDGGGNPPTITAEYCVQGAWGQQDPLIFGFSEHAISLPGVSNKFVFKSDARWVEMSDGTARLTGTSYDKYDVSKILIVDVSFAGRTEIAPPDSPKLELFDTAYIDQGGPVDPDTWYYYTEFSGQLVGMDYLAGITFDISRMGPSYQVGNGASGKNIYSGSSGWFEYDNSVYSGSTGKGDFNLDFYKCRDDDTPDDGGGIGV